LEDVKAKYAELENLAKADKTAYEQMERDCKFFKGEMKRLREQFVDAKKEATQFKALYNGIGKKAARKMAKTAMQEVLVVEGTEGK
jgi:hypothetical protein